MNVDPRSALGPLAVALACVVSSACHAVLGPSGTDGNWHVRDGDRVSLFVRPNSFAESIAPGLIPVAEDQYAYTIGALALGYGGHVNVYLYNSAADAGLDGDRSGTAYSMTEAARVVCVAPLDDNLVTLVNHELNHVVIIGGLGRAGTSFVTEGLASAMLSEHYAKVGPTFLYSWTRTHRASLPHVATLMDDDNWPGSDQNVSYNTAASFLAYLHQTYGAPSIRDIYAARSGSLPSRVAEVYKKSVDALEEEWLRFCDQQP